MSLTNKLIEWTHATFQPLGAWGLFILAFIESSFFPIPPDLLLITLSLFEPEKAFFFALICTIGSVLGGMFGYLIGYIGEIAILRKLFSEEKIKKVHNLFNKYEVWAIAIAGFTPIPYKIFTISAGVFYINFWKFVITSFWSRGARFFLEATLLYFFGKFILNFLNNYFDWISLIGVALLIVIYIIYKKIKNKKVKA
ncbi:MAG: YqaA family protein [Nanoarchaeota archaeon]